jgi:hypothetical protein
MADRDEPTYCRKCGRLALNWHVSEYAMHDYKVRCSFCQSTVGWKTEAQLAVQRSVADVKVIPLPQPGATLDEFFI